MSISCRLPVPTTNRARPAARCICPDRWPSRFCIAAAQSRFRVLPTRDQSHVHTVPHPPKSRKRPSPSRRRSEPNTTLKVNVKLVNVFATVTDAGGAPVSTLKQDDFQIFEDGKPQKIAVFQRESELPLSIVMAIDTSLSTRNPTRSWNWNRRGGFAHAILRPIDGVSLFRVQRDGRSAHAFHRRHARDRQGHQPRPHRRGHRAVRHAVPGLGCAACTAAAAR